MALKSGVPKHTMMDESAGPLDWDTYQTLGTATYYDNGGQGVVASGERDPQQDGAISEFG